MTHLQFNSDLGHNVRVLAGGWARPVQRGRCPYLRLPLLPGSTLSTIGARSKINARGSQRRARGPRTTFTTLDTGAVGAYLCPAHDRDILLQVVLLLAPCSIYRGKYRCGACYNPYQP